LMSIALRSSPEFDLIRSFFGEHGPAAHPDVRVGPGDDCAIVGDIALTTDVSIEEIHFRREWLGPAEIGFRATAAALSDLAAVAAAPVGVLVSLAVPAADTPDAARKIMEGVASAVARAGGVLLGGDVSRISGPIVIDVVAVGRTSAPLLRSGARPGDGVWVTGRLGAAAAAVRSWRRGAEPHEAARRAFAAPSPRIAEARWLAERGAMHTLIDLSDGLGGDAAHIAVASNVRIVLDAESVPGHDAARAEASGDDDALRLALDGGEDYELCFTAPPGAVERVADEFRASFTVPLTRVGTVEAGTGVALRSGGSITELTGLGH